MIRSVADISMERLTAILKELNVPLVKYTEWHYLIADRFDYYPTKFKWYDRKGVYGTQYDLDNLVEIIKKGPTEPAGEVKQWRPLYQIVDDLENLLEELREHL